MWQFWRKSAAALLVLTFLGPSEPAPAGVTVASPEVACGDAIFASPSFASFLSSNPQLRSLSHADQKRAYVARGLVASADVLRAATKTAKDVGLTQDDHSEDIEVDVEDYLPPGVDIARIQLPADHASFEVIPLVQARIEMAAGANTDTVGRLRLLLNEMRGRWGDSSPRLLPILLVYSDALRSNSEADEAAVVDRQFLSIAHAHPERARPLNRSIQSVSYRLSEYYERQARALEVDNIWGGENQILKARRNATDFNTEAEAARRRGTFYIENIVPLVIGSLPGGAPMSLAQVTMPTSTPSEGATSIGAIVNSTITLVVAVSDLDSGKTVSLGAARDAAARPSAMTGCLIESGKAFAAWDATAGMKTFRTALDQVDARTAAQAVRLMIEGGDLRAAFSPKSGLNALDDDDASDWLAWSLGGFAAAYGNGDLPKIADVLEALLSDQVLTEVANGLEKAAIGEDKDSPSAKQNRKALRALGPYVAGLVQKLRPVVADTLREPSPKSERDTVELRDWLARTEKPFKTRLMKVARDQLLGADDYRREDFEQQLPELMKSYDTVYPLLTGFADGLVVKAAIANNDMVGARRAAAIAAQRTAVYLATAPSSPQTDDILRAGLRAGTTLTSARAIDEGYADAARDLAAAMGVTIYAKFNSMSEAFSEGEFDEAPTEANPPPSSDEERLGLKLQEATASLGGDFLWGETSPSPEMTNARSKLVSELFTLLAARNKDTNWLELMRNGLDPATLKPFKRQTATNLANLFGGVDPLFERGLTITSTHLTALKTANRPQETAMVGDICAAAVHWWSTASVETRKSYGAVAPESFYRALISWLIQFDRPEEAETVAKFWVEAKRSPFAIPRPALNIQMRAWRQDRSAWTIQAWLTTSRLFRAAKPADADLDLLLNAMDAANRNVTGADFTARLQAGQLPPSARKAYFDWAGASQRLEAIRFGSIANAKAALNLIGATTAFSLASQDEQDSLRDAEAKTWDTYQASLRANGIAPPLVTYRTVTQTLTPDEVLLTGFVIDDRVVMMALAPGRTPRMTIAPISYSQVRRLVDGYKRDLTLTKTGGAPRTFDRDNAAALWAVIGAPAQPYLKSATRLVWTPPQGLNDFSLTALPVSGLGDTGWLGLDREVMVVPSLETFLSLRRAPNVTYRQRLLAVGDIAFGQSGARSLGADNPLLAPTPGAHEAFDAVAREVPTSSIVLRDKNATKSRLNSLKGQAFDVALFYTHGVTPHDGALCGRPLTQALALFQDQGCADALLSPDEAAALQIKARVVVLAACATSAAPDSELGPLGGLTRAFLVGGAQSVIGAHLPVADRAAAQFTPMVVEELSTRRGASSALRISLVRLRSQPGLSSPAYWGQFEIVGEGAYLPAQTPERPRTST